MTIKKTNITSFTIRPDGNDACILRKRVRFFTANGSKARRIMQAFVTQWNAQHPDFTFTTKNPCSASSKISKYPH